MCFSLEVPAVVVGVVGMGHVPGIEKNWDKDLNIHEIMRCVSAVTVVCIVVCYCTRFVMTKIFVSFLLAWLLPLVLAGCYARC